MITECSTLLGGRYELDQIIGRGGMAKVWQARDLRLVHDVAIKRLRIDLVSNPTFQARFRREVQSAAGLNHPNIVVVHDIGEERGTKLDVMVPHIVMELIEGVALREVLRDGCKIMPVRALELAAGTLNALSYSHRAGIIHRDIKPANAMLTPAGTMRVMDFNIAQVVTDTLATMTQTVAVIEIVQHLSPEQAHGEKADQRLDLYSVGYLSYRLLCSEPPFRGDSPVSVVHQHAQEAPVSLSQRSLKVIPVMDAITSKALAKSSDDRYQDARGSREDILRTLNGRPVMATYSLPVEMSTTVMPSPAWRAASTLLITPPDANSAAETTSVNGAAGTMNDIADPVEAEEESKKKREILVAISVLAVLLVTGITTAVYMVLNLGPRQAQIPNVIGAPQASAEATLKKQDSVTKVESVESNDANKGKVADTDPKIGTQATSGSTMTLKVGTGPTQLKVPGVKGKSFDDALKVPESAGFTGQVSKIDMGPAREATDAVGDQAQETESATGQAVAPDQIITIRATTSKSTVPGFTGIIIDETRSKVSELEFEMGVSVLKKEGTAQTAGKVFAQDPKEETALECKSEKITITIARATPATTRAPNLISMDEGRATQVFKGAGLMGNLRVTKVTATDPTKPADRIYSQNITPDTEPDKNPFDVSVKVIIPPQATVPTNPFPSPLPFKTD